ncbi:MAG: PASTA domain-containing protein [Solirubrobacterales bacterium]|nr:PASTA domain-containing protein [Solirubrobacterales bacterium]
MPEPLERGRNADFKGLRDWRLWGAVAAVVAVALAAILLLGGGDSDQGVGVPYVVGLDQQAASGQLVANGFSTQVERRRSTEPPRTVVGQEPDAGSPLEPGQVVVLIVSDQSGAAGLGAEEPSSGPARVPDLVGRQHVLAGAALERLGLVPDTRPVQAGDTCGEVASQEPKPGTKLKVGDSVRMTVSSGGGERLDVPVPDLEGLLASTARSQARELGFTLHTVEGAAPSPDLAGKVLKQSPRAALNVPELSRIKLVVGR